MRTETGGDWGRTRSREAYRLFNLSHVEKKNPVLTVLASSLDSRGSLLAGSFLHCLAGSWSFCHNHPRSEQNLKNSKKRLVTFSCMFFAY